MSKTACVCIAVASIALNAAASSAQTAAIPRHLDTARAAEGVGDYAGAAREYFAALELSASASPEQRAQISLNLAHLLATLETVPATVQPDGSQVDAWKTIAPAGVSGLSRPDMMRRLYQAAIEAGTPTQQDLARNDLGTLLLKEQRYAEALDVLRRLDQSRDPARRFVYSYNVGRAYEANRQSTAALTAYLRAVAGRPAFTPAVDSSLALLEGAERLDADAAVALVTTLLSNGEIRSAGRVTSRLLTRWAADNAAPRLLALWLRRFVAASIDLPTCQKSEVPFLDSLRGSNDLRAFIQDVKRACLDDKLPERLQFGDRSGFSSRWMAGWRPVRDILDNPRTSFAAFLTAIGRQFEERQDYRQALVRHLAAWALDKSNAESAVNAAMVLQAHPDTDRTGGVLDALIEDIFAAKGDFIAERDWPNSQRLHIVLARIFEKLDRWGPVTNPHSALFQWTAAIADDAEIRKTTPSLAPSPGLYERLGDCYRRAKQPNLPAAAEQYRVAAREFAVIGRQEDADRLRRLSEELGRPR